MGRPNSPWYRKAKNTWYVKVNGKLHSLGVRGKENKTAAWAALHAFLNPPPAVTPEPSPALPVELTVTVACGQYLAACRLTLKEKTVTRYAFDIGKFEKAFGQRLLREITPDDLRTWVAGIKGASTTRAIMLRSVSSLFGWCVREGKLELNPVRKVKRPKTASRSDKTLISDEDHQTLLKAASKHFRDVLLLLHGTGCRPGEISQVTAEAFNPESRTVVITEHKTDRTGKPRIIYLTSELTALLQQRADKYRKGPLLRGKRGNAWSGRAVMESMKKLRKKTGVKAIAYGYRHGFVTRGLENGLSNSIVASLVGHTSTAVIDKYYSHLGAKGDVLRQALDKMSKAAWPDTKKLPNPKAEE